MLDTTFVRFAGVSPPSRPPPPLPAGAAPEPERAAAPFFQWLFRRVGVDVRPYQARGLHRRFPACLRALRVSTEQEARALLERRPWRIPDALDAVLIGVTDFFRDPQVFHAIETVVLPEILAARPRLRVASIGCSDGRELHSIAMLAEEAGALDRADLLGIDLRPGAVDRAALGRYAPDHVVSLAEERRARHLERRGEDWEVRPALRRRCAWRVGDLFGFASGEPFDLLLFRNLGIYLTPEGGRQACGALAGALRPGGWLVTGQAERPAPDAPFTRVAPCLYRRRAT